MSATDFGKLDINYAGGDWRNRVGFLSHDNVIHLWSGKEQKWTPVTMLAATPDRAVPQSEPAQRP